MKEINPFEDIKPKSIEGQRKMASFRIASKSVTRDLVKFTIVEEFTDLDDTPSSITANRVLIGNSGGTAVEQIAGASGSFNDGDANTVSVLNGIITSLS